MPTIVKLYTYAKPLAVKGSMMAQVFLGDKEEVISIGINRWWSKPVGLRLAATAKARLAADNKLNREALQQVLQGHEDIFEDRLVAEGIIEPVQFADWAAPKSQDLW